MWRWRTVHCIHIARLLNGNDVGVVSKFSVSDRTVILSLIVLVEMQLQQVLRMKWLSRYGIHLTLGGEE